MNSFEPFLGGELVLIAVLGDLDPAHQFHDEVGPAGLGRAGVEHLRDVRMVHHRQRLALGLEPGDDLPAVHAQLDDLEGDAAFDRLALLGHPDFAKAAFADLLQQLVAAKHLGRGFLDWEFGNAGPLSLQGRSRQEAVVRKMLLQQFLHLAAESDIPAARALKIYRTRLRRGHLQGFKKNFPFGHDSNRFVRCRSSRQP